MIAIVRSSPYSGGTYRNKEGVTCKSFSEYAVEMTRLWDLATKEQTEETIRIEIKQEAKGATK